MKVAGHCPMGCGQTLMLGDGGHITCVLDACPDPSAVDTILADPETEHVVVFAPNHFNVLHPLRERLGHNLLDCSLAAVIAALQGPPFPPGRYRASRREHDGYSESFRSDGLGAWSFEPVDDAAS